MASESDNPPLIVIVGETGSGKTALGLEISALYGGEIICADSRTIYRGMDIASAKPTSLERQQVRHHMLDIIDPDKTFSAAQFKQMATQCIRDIAAREHVAVMVGGSGLYIDSVLFDYDFSMLPDASERRRLQGLRIDVLQAEIIQKGIAMPSNAKNPRHLMRAIETGGTSQKRRGLRGNTLVLGLAIDRVVLQQRITNRANKMFEHDLVEETKALSDAFGWDAPALQAPGYGALRDYIEGRIGESEAKQLFIQSHLKLAKRQRTWFKRNKSIHWISKQADAVDLVTTFLNK